MEDPFRECYFEEKLLWIYDLGYRTRSPQGLRARMRLVFYMFGFGQ